MMDRRGVSREKARGGLHYFLAAPGVKKENGCGLRNPKAFFSNPRDDPIFSAPRHELGVKIREAG